MTPILGLPRPPTDQAEHVQDEASDRFRVWRTRREPRIPKPPGPVCPLWGDPTKELEKNTGKNVGTRRKRENAWEIQKIEWLLGLKTWEDFFLLTVAKIMTFCWFIWAITPIQSYGTDYNKGAAARILLDEPVACHKNEEMVSC